jgi:hypothetical protein
MRAIRRDKTEVLAMRFNLPEVSALEKIPNLHRQGATLFVPLPVSLRRPINGGCQCQYCVEHPLCTPQWDTLAIAQKDSTTYTWTVHYPEIALAARRAHL